MPRAGLSRAVIAAAGADLADEIGWQDITLAAVAARFGGPQAWGAAAPGLER